MNLKNDHFIDTTIDNDFGKEAIEQIKQLRNTNKRITYKRNKEKHAIKSIHKIQFPFIKNKIEVNMQKTSQEKYNTSLEKED